MSRIKWTIPSKNFVLLREYAQAQYFIRTVYPHYPDCTVITADKQMPVLEDTQVEVWDYWFNDPKLRIVVFDKQALRMMGKPRTEHICVMDMLLSHAQVGRKSRLNVRSQITYTPEMIAVQLDHFFGQRGAGGGYSAGGGQQRQNYNIPEDTWINSLYK